MLYGDMFDQIYSEEVQILTMIENRIVQFLQEILRLV